MRAIAGSKGSAGFSEIRDATGLSTGSIYYHLERMSKYIIKDAKQYLITQDGWEILREIDVKSPDVRKDECSESDDQHPEPLRVGTKKSIALNILRGNRFILLAIAIVASISIGIYSQSYALFPGISYAGKMIANATMISSLSIADSSILIIFDYVEETNDTQRIQGVNDIIINCRVSYFGEYLDLYWSGHANSNKS